MKRFLVLLFLLSTGILFAKNLTVQETYRTFTENFKQKRFDNCLRYLSDKDFEEYKKVAEFNNWQGNIDELLIKELFEMWNLYYNMEQKKQQIQNLKLMRERDTKEMENALREMQDLKEIKDLKKQIESQKFNADEQILLMIASSKVLGEITEKKIIQNRAMIATYFEYIFPKNLTKQVQDLLIDQKEKSYNIAKVRKLQGSTLSMYFLYAFEKNEDDQWRILFFSRDNFDTTGFESFINKYENINE